MNEVIVAVISAVGSGAFFAFLQYLISRRDGKNEWRKSVDERFEKVDERFDKIDERQVKGEKDDIRLQLMFLMYVRPDNKEEILQLADYYFRVLKADFYLTPLFQKWLIEHDMEIPAWFSTD